MYTGLCPIAAMLQYLSRRPRVKGHFSCAKQESNSQTLRCAGIDSTLYKGHSFRIGAATTAAAYGISESLIKTMGRWSMTDYKRYIWTPASELQKVSGQLASHNVV